MPKLDMRIVRQKAEEARKDPKRICGAFAPRSKDGICHNWAGARTDHKGTGYCWLHDKAHEKKISKARPVDLVSLSSEQLEDPDVLELKNEIKMVRERIQVAREEENDKLLALLLDTLRKLVDTKNKIELQRQYLIPVSVAVNAAKRVTDVIAKYLPEEQRYALRGEVAEALRIELATTPEGEWIDPVADWARRKA